MSTSIIPFVEQGLIINSLRGDDGTGLFMVSETGKLETYKKPLPGWDFVQLDKAKKMLSMNAIKCRFVVAHNRATTRGDDSVDHTHPVQHGCITLVQNGTLTGYHELGKGETHDTTAVAIALHEAQVAGKAEKDVLCKLNGPFVLIWYNAVKNSLFIARNAGRPLWLGFIEEGKGLLFASEPTMMSWLADRNHITLKSVKELKEFHINEIPLDVKDKTVIKKFEDYVAPVWRGQTFTVTNPSTKYMATYEGTITRWDADAKANKTLYKFKLLADSAYAWVADIKNFPESLLDANGTPRVSMQKDYWILPLEPRMSTNDSSDKHCKVLEEAVVLALPLPPKKERKDSLADYYKVGNKINFCVHDVKPSGHNRLYIDGATEDSNYSPVKVYSEYLDWSPEIGDICVGEIADVIINKRTEDEFLRLKHIKKFHGNIEYCVQCMCLLSEATGRHERTDRATKLLFCDGCVRMFDHIEDRDNFNRGLCQ